jgi:hypothetical protein
MRKKRRFVTLHRIYACEKKWSIDTGEVSNVYSAAQRRIIEHEKISEL